MSTLLKCFQNLSVRNQILGAHNLSSGTWQISFFHTSPVLGAEPLKKKKKLDPTIIKERAEKKVRRLQRDIRKLEKVAKKYKPLSELEVPRKIYRDSELQRPDVILTEAELIERIQLKHEWAVFKRKQHVAEMWAIQRVVNAQEKALDALEETSRELYEEALEPDPVFIPFTMSGPTDTPPIQNYDYPDGDYKDITKEYLPIIPTDPKKQKKLGLLKKK